MQLEQKTKAQTRTGTPSNPPCPLPLRKMKRKKGSYLATRVRWSFPKSDIFLSQSALSEPRAATAADRPRNQLLVNRP